MEHHAYQPLCNCSRARGWLAPKKPKNKGSKRRKRRPKSPPQPRLDDRNQTCAVHKLDADWGVLAAHDEVLRHIPHALVLSEVGFRSLGKTGRLFASGWFSSEPDLFVDLLVRSPNGVYSAVEVTGREHRHGDGPDRDAKKMAFLEAYAVPLVTLKLKNDRSVDTDQWQQEFVNARKCGWHASR